MQIAPKPALVGDGEIFLDGEAGRGAARRILKHPRDETRSPLHRYIGDILAGDRHRAGIRRHIARDDREQRTLARAVAADQHREIALRQRKIDAVQRPPFGRGAAVEDLGDARDP